MAGAADLPDEIVEAVMACLPFVEAARCRRVCRAWRAAADETIRRDLAGVGRDALLPTLVNQLGRGRRCAATQRWFLGLMRRDPERPQERSTKTFPERQAAVALGVRLDGLQPWEVKILARNATFDDRPDTCRWLLDTYEEHIAACLSGLNSEACMMGAFDASRVWCAHPSLPMNEVCSVLFYAVEAAGGADYIRWVFTEHPRAAEIDKTFASIIIVEAADALRNGGEATKIMNWFLAPTSAGGYGLKPSELDHKSLSKYVHQILVLASDQAVENFARLGGLDREEISLDTVWPFLSDNKRGVCERLASPP